jgi:succinyl-CoA synthetase alpha subunit
MSILVDRGTRLVVQGITGRDGAFHTRQMIDYGTKVVAGVTPGKGGETVHGVPVFDTVAEAMAETRCNTSVIYVPAPFAADAVFEAADAGLGLIVCITEGIPVRDNLAAYHHVATLRERNGKGRPRLVGPNCPGLLSPGQSKVGIMPGHICKPGPVGVVSRSGTLTYEVVHQLTGAGLGQSTCLGIGGDPVIGTNFVDALELFEADPQTEAIVLIGEIGGNDEEEAARFVKRHIRKPVVAFVAGQTAPPGKRMGHAGAIISGGSGTAAEKMAAFKAAGIPVARIPSEIPELIAESLGRRRSRSGGRAASGANRAKRNGTPAARGASAPRSRSKPTHSRSKRAPQKSRRTN